MADKRKPDSADEEGTAPKKPKLGTDLTTKAAEDTRKRRLFKAPITHLVGNSFGDVRKENDDGTLNQVIAGQGGAWKLTFPPVDEENTLEQWEGFRFTKALSRGCIGIFCNFPVDLPRDCLAEPFLGPAAAHMVHRQGEISLVELVL